MKKELITFLQEKENPGDWVNIAEKFDVTGTKKQKSDYVRRLWKKIHKPYSESYIDLNGNQVSVAGFGKGFPKYVTVSDTRAITKEEVDRLEHKHNVLNPAAKQVKNYLRLEQLDPRLKQIVEDWERLSLQSTVKTNPKNVLVIGDIHEPFCKKGYLEFCKQQQVKYNCEKVVFIGDIIDNHAQSFHNTDPDGLSAKQELELAVKNLEKWYEAFPEADVCLGNHDRIVARKLFGVGVSQRWLKPLGEVLNTPNWNFVEQLLYNDVLYVHGEGGTALKKAQQEMCSVVQGHLHTEGYVQLLNGGSNFAMQVGCGIDFDSYAFAYAQRGKKPILSCGVVLDKSPIIIPFLND